MANPNPVPNPNIAEAGKATQFGAGLDPVANARKSRPWSIRNSLTYLAAQEVNADSSTNDAFAFEKGEKVTRARRIAMRTLKLADEGNIKAVEFVTENIEGRLVQPTQELPPPDKMPENCMTEEEAAAIHATYAKK